MLMNGFKIGRSHPYIQQSPTPLQIKKSGPSKDWWLVSTISQCHDEELSLL